MRAAAHVCAGVSGSDLVSTSTLFQRPSLHELTQRRAHTPDVLLHALAHARSSVCAGAHTHRTQACLRGRARTHVHPHMRTTHACMRINLPAPLLASLMHFTLMRDGCLPPTQSPATVPEFSAQRSPAPPTATSAQAPATAPNVPPATL